MAQRVYYSQQEQSASSPVSQTLAAAGPQHNRNLQWRAVQPPENLQASHREASPDSAPSLL